MKRTMLAIQSVAPGGPETLELNSVPVPEPGPGEVRVSVAAAGVNYPDLLIIDDRYQFRPERPFSPGAEIAGTVEAVGEGVDRPVVGTRIMAMLGWGGMAEKVILSAADCFSLPDEMGFEDAAAFLMTYGTSWHALRDRAGLRAGERLLVLGAGGGVGSAAVELGLALGAKVIAAASSSAKLELSRGMGDVAGVVYPPGPLDRDAQRSLTAGIRDACEGAGPDVVYDPVGGSYAEPALRSIVRGGRYLVVGFPAGIPAIPLNLPLLKECDLRGVFWGSHIANAPEQHRAAVAELIELYRAGKIRPRIHATRPLREAGEAIALLSSRSTTGKIVVTVP